MFEVEIESMTIKDDDGNKDKTNKQNGSHS